MKWISQAKICALVILASAPLAAQAYTVIINGTSFETSRPPSVDVAYLSDGVRVTISEVDITADASSSSSSSDSGECTSTWGCGSDSSSDDSGSDDSSSNDSSSDSSNDVNSSSTGDCTNTSRVACHNQDWGPNGLRSFWATSHTVPAGKVFSVPFTVKPSGPGPYGTIATSRASGQTTNGYSIRMWFSETPGGKRLDSTSACGRVTSATGGVRWVQANQRSGYCNLPSTELKTYYYNVALCNSSSSSDIECLGNSEFNPKPYTMLFKASAY